MLSENVYMRHVQLESLIIIKNKKKTLHLFAFKKQLIIRII